MVTKEQSIQATIDALLLGLKISQAEVEKQKKLVSYYKLYISKRLEKDKEE